MMTIYWPIVSIWNLFIQISLSRLKIFLKWIYLIGFCFQLQIYVYEEASSKLQEELIEITTNEELKIKFKGGSQQFWLQKQIPTLYPQFWAIVQKFLIPFSTSYLVERGFSVVTNLLTTKRNRLQIIDHGDLWLLLTKLNPNIEKLMEKYRVHPFH